ncbi:hypothetical protein L1049_022137 [Liquidambar formosana]|uniref:MULE transposase domain-containing protein n=1 Tax=Liquidambar formosana TaxID=63359 RepID=A0AAP0WQM6_LIQFO
MSCWRNMVLKYIRCDYIKQKGSVWMQLKGTMRSVMAMKTGFINRCRPFLGLDGCHLKRPYGGVLLGAVALDENHKPYTFMTDRHKGVIDAISEYFPEANQRHCCRHFYNNFMARFPGILLRDHFWDAARACNRQEFNESMDAMKTINTAAYNWLMEIPVTQ